jgi:hypothetical protein
LCGISCSNAREDAKTASKLRAGDEHEPPEVASSRCDAMRLDPERRWQEGESLPRTIVEQADDAIGGASLATRRPSAARRRR